MSLMKYLCFIGLFLVVTVVPAQRYILKKDGELIRFETYFLKNDSLRIVYPGLQKKEKISIQDVEGFFSLDEKTTRYLRPKIHTSPKGVLDFSSSDYQFVERIEDGTINIYESTYTRSTPTGIGPLVTYSYLYVEKNGLYRLVVNANVYEWGEKRKNALREQERKLLSPFLEDDSIAYNTVKNGNHDASSIIKMVEQYNLRAHRPTSTTTTPTRKVVFCRKKRNQAKAPIYLQIGDSQFELIPASKVAMELPVDNHTKISISYGSRTDFDLIIGSKYYDKCYELNYNKGGNMKFESQNREYVKFYLKDYSIAPTIID